jgi:hypothetical protein
MTAPLELGGREAGRVGLEAGRFERLIVLHCPDCGREAAVARDDTDPYE